MLHEQHEKVSYGSALHTAAVLLLRQRIPAKCVLTSAHITNNASANRSMTSCRKSGGDWQGGMLRRALWARVQLAGKKGLGFSGLLWAWRDASEWVTKEERCNPPRQRG